MAKQSADKVAQRLLDLELVDYHELETLRRTCRTTSTAPTC